MQSKLHHLFVFFIFLNFSTVQAQLTLTEHIVIDETNSGKPNKVKFADIDGDGDLDLISTNKNPLELVWFENLDGTGNYSEKHFVGAIGFNSSVYPGDIDNDGDIDLVTASNISSPVKIQAFINQDGLGTFSTPILIQDISSDPSRDVYLADIDGDNDLDVITAYGSGGIAWIENLGNNTFSSGLNQFSLNFYGVDKIVTADIDNDGDMDIIGSRGRNNRIAWFENYDGQGDFGYNNPQYIHTGPGSSQNKADFCVTDVDGDTYKDLVISSSTQNKISWYKNLDGQGNFGNEIVINSTLLGISSFYCGDIDNDGDIDIAGIRRVYNDVFWIRNLDGLGNFSDTNEIHTQTLYPKQPLLTDLNMDNSLDIVFISDASNQIVWMKNQNSTGNFVTPTNLYYSIDEPEYANAHDLDGDNDLDILVCSYDDGKISWFENLDGTGNFGAQKIITSIAENLTYLAVGDLDSDGDLDIVSITTFTGSRVSWYENLDGLGNFGEENIISTSIVNGSAVLVADLDNDNDLDVISASNDDDKIAWYENLDGLGNFGTQNIITNFAGGVTSISLGDFNNDGLIDIASCEAQDKDIMWYKNNNNATTWNAFGIYLSNSSSGIGSFVHTADMNNDGYDDVLTASNSHGANLFANNQNQIFLGSYVNFPIDENNTICATDLDSDGDQDILTLDIYGTLNEVVWYENLNPSSLTFGNKQIISQNLDRPKIVNSADINGDGIDDIIATSRFHKVVWYENTTNLSVNKFNKDSFALYPNPAKNLLNIKSKSSINDITVFDINGRVISSKKLSNFTKEFQLNIKELAEGIYFVKIQTSFGAQTQKLIKG